MIARALALALISPLAWAAGGHHAVDDAAILEPGRCEAEAWISHAQGGGDALHAGPGCRVGPLELSAALDHAPGEHSAAFQVKAAWPLGENLAAGVSATPFRRGGAVRDEGASLVMLATWVSGPWSVHLNAGREFASSANTAKSGVSAEWAPGAWSWVFERYTERAGHFARAGVRWHPTNAWALDVSHARLLHGAGASVSTIGSTWGFATP